MTYTYARLPISATAYDEIRSRMINVDYLHAIHEGPEGEIIDMHGIALERMEPGIDELHGLTPGENPIGGILKK